MCARFFRRLLREVAGLYSFPLSSNAVGQTISRRARCGYIGTVWRNACWMISLVGSDLITYDRRLSKVSA